MSAAGVRRRAAGRGEKRIGRGRRRAMDERFADSGDGMRRIASAERATTAGNEARRMNDAAWQMPLAPLCEDERIERILAAHHAMHEAHFAGDAAINEALPIMARSTRSTGGWFLTVVLTPWMLARLAIPESQPSIALPAGWSAAEREGAPFVLLGPVRACVILGARLRGHLAYHPLLGHYLLQPLCLAMQPYGSAEQVFAAWDEVIETRSENMRKREIDSPWHKELSRRELFGRRAPREED
jgi:hypothetical protein